jgi:CheY-like chemotaxis protein
MIVDDDVDGRDALTRLLRYAGYVVCTASNGQEALEMLRAAGRRPDLILLDVMMPGMDGRGFRHTQKADPDLSHIPVVVVSAQGELERLIEAEAYLDKPLEFDTLVDTVDRLVKPEPPASLRAETA